MAAERAAQESVSSAGTPSLAVVLKVVDKFRTILLDWEQR